MKKFDLKMIKLPQRIFYVTTATLFAFFQKRLNTCLKIKQKKRIEWTRKGYPLVDWSITKPQKPRAIINLFSFTIWTLYRFVKNKSNHFTTLEKEGYFYI